MPPDCDDALDDLHILLSVCKAVGHGWDKAAGFIRRWVPQMSDKAAKRAYDAANLATAYLKADTMAKRLGVTWAVRCSLNVRTIGAIDKPKAEREKIRRAKGGAKRKKNKSAKPKRMKPRESAVLRMIGSMSSMGEVARKAKRHRLFHDLQNVPLEVRRIVDRLRKSGHLGCRLEPRHRGGKEWFLWRLQAEERAAAQAHSKNAPRRTPIFAETNRGADSCVNIPVGNAKEYDPDAAMTNNNEPKAA